MAGWWLLVSGPVQAECWIGLTVWSSIRHPSICWCVTRGTTASFAFLARQQRPRSLVVPMCGIIIIHCRSTTNGPTFDFVVLLYYYIYFAKTKKHKNKQTAKQKLPRRATVLPHTFCRAIQPSSRRPQYHSCLLYTSPSPRDRG